MSRDKEQQFIDGIKAGLDRSVEELDALPLARLKAARLAALDSPRQQANWFSRQRMVMATAMSTLLVVSVWLLQSPEKGKLPMDDLPLLTASEDFELYRDLEFYQWLEHESEKG